MFPSPNPCRATNVRGDTLIQTILPPAKHGENSVENDRVVVSEREDSNKSDNAEGTDSDGIDSSETEEDAAASEREDSNISDNAEGTDSDGIDSSETGAPEQSRSDSQTDDTYPFFSRPSLDNNEVDLDFASIVLHFIKHHVSEGNVPNNFGSFDTFISNVSDNFYEKFRKMVDESKTEPGGKPDRKKVMLNLAELLVASCNGTTAADWVAIANQVLITVDEHYEGEPLGETNFSNTFVGVCSGKGSGFPERDSNDGDEDNDEDTNAEDTDDETSEGDGTEWEASDSEDSDSGDSQSCETYPLKQRLDLENNAINEDFANILFQIVAGTVTSNPAATGMYQKEYNVSVQKSIPDLGSLENYLQFVEESRRCGSKWSHHQHGQFTEAIPEKVRKDFGSYDTFLDNLSHDFLQKIRRVVNEAKTAPCARPDRKKVLLNLAELLATSCSASKREDWIFIAGEVLKEVDELYVGEPLGEAKISNIPVGYGSKKGVVYWNRPTKKNGNQKKARRKQKKKRGKTGEDQEEKKIIFLEDVITMEMGIELFQELNSLTQTELATLLYYRDKHGAIRSMYNGRAFGWIDVEHWLVSFIILLFCWVCIPVLLTPFFILVQSLSFHQGKV